MAAVGIALVAAIASAVVDKPPQPVTVRVGAAAPLTARVADSPDERNRGLMGVEDLHGRRGMVFVFDRREFVTFYMYRTLIPLSIAFIDGDRVVGVREMEPCPEEDPRNCPTVVSPSPVTRAVEAPGGFFTTAGVDVGDRVTITTAQDS
jgi:uncharacterized membrane protein (UPF0127 family)